MQDIFFLYQDFEKSKWTIWTNTSFLDSMISVVYLFQFNSANSEFFILTYFIILTYFLSFLDNSFLSFFDNSFKGAYFINPKTAVITVFPKFHICYVLTV